MTKRDPLSMNDATGTTGADCLSGQELDQVFEAARQAPPDPVPEVSPALLERVLADALAAQPVRHAPERRRAPVVVWQGLRGALGGWAGFSGLAFAGCCGLMIGLGAPDLRGGATGAGAFAEAGLAVLLGTGETPDVLSAPWAGHGLSLLVVEDAS